MSRQRKLRNPPIETAASLDGGLRRSAPDPPCALHGSGLFEAVARLVVSNFYAAGFTSSYFQPQLHLPRKP